MAWKGDRCTFFFHKCIWYSDQVWAKPGSWEKTCMILKVSRVVLCYVGNRGSFSCGKMAWAWRQLLIPSNANVKNEWICTSPLHILLTLLFSHKQVWKYEVTPLSLWALWTDCHWKQWPVVIWRLGLVEQHNATLCTLLLDLTSGLIFTSSWKLSHKTEFCLLCSEI